MHDLWRRLFLATALPIVLALAAMVLILQYDFRQGFQGYVFALDEQRANGIVTRLARFRGEQGDWNALRHDPGLLRFFAAEDAADAVRPQRPLPRPEPGPFGRPGPRGPGSPGPGDPPALRGTGPEWMSRLSLFDEQGLLLHGSPIRRPGGASLAIEVDGARVGELYLQPAPALRDEPARHFLRNQLVRAIGISLVVLLLALVVSWLVARRLLAPLPAISGAVRRLARGEYEGPVPAREPGAFAELADDVRQLAKALAAHEQSRRQWTADIAHELRTPVSILLGEIEAIEDGVRAADAASLASLRSECLRLKRLVDDLYQLALSDVGGLHYRFAPVDLAALVRARLAVSRPGLTQAGLVLDAQVPDEPIRIDGDHDRLEQLLANLLGNAHRYTDAPGTVRVSLRTDRDRALLTVEDSPPGVPDAALPRLFERLYRVEASRNRDSGGAGLGLAIAERIVTAHRGRISARHGRLGGLAIDIELPIIQP